MSNISNYCKSFCSFVSEKSPLILTSLGVIGVMTTTALSSKSAIDSVKIIEHEKECREIDRQHGIDARFAPYDISVKDCIELCWKKYIFTALSMAGTITCIISSNSIHSKRAAALATAYKLSETAFTRYRNSVIETVGKKKEKEIRDKVAEKDLKSNKKSAENVIITNTTSSKCYDSISGRYFTSSINKIDKAINIINREMLLHDYVSLNTFYEELGLEPTQNGDLLGWKLLSRPDMVYVDYEACMDYNGEPCLYLNYSVEPKHGYSTYM